MATRSPVCCVGAGDRPLLHPHNLHNELRACLSLSFPCNAGVVTALTGHCPSPILYPHLACGVFFSFFGGASGSMKKAASLFCGVLSVVAVSLKRRSSSLLLPNMLAEGRGTRQQVLRDRAGFPHCTIHLLLCSSFLSGKSRWASSQEAESSQIIIITWGFTIAHEHVGG